MLKFVKGVLIALSVLFITEIALRFFEAPLELEYIDKPDFYYLYIDIHNPFYKADTANGSKILKPVRMRNVSDSFPAKKQEDTIRIFFAGGSAAEIIGNNSYKELRKRLHILYPGKNLEILNCAIGGYNSYRVLLVLKEIIDYSPDLIVVMSGNNESQPLIDKNISWVYKNRITYNIHISLRKLHLYRKLQNIMHNTIDLKFFPKDICDNLRSNLNKMADLAEKNNIALALCTLPVNYVDAPPNWDSPIEDRDFTMSLLMSENGDYSNSIKLLKTLKDRYPDNPLIYFHIAQNCKKEGKQEEAEINYNIAADKDPTKGGQAINRVIKDVADTRDLILIDFDQRLYHENGNRLPGFNFFYDSCHFYSTVNSIFADESAKVIYRTFVKDHAGHSLSELKDSSIKKLPEINLKAILKKRKFYIKRMWLETISESFEESNYEQNISFFMEIYRNSPELLESTLDSKDIIMKTFEEYKWGSLNENLERSWSTVLWKIGEAYRRIGDYNKSLLYLNSSIKLNNNSFRAYFFRGLAYLKSGDTQKASEDFNNLQKINSNFGWINNFLALNKT